MQCIVYCLNDEYIYCYMMDIKQNVRYVKKIGITRTSTASSPRVWMT